MTQPLSAHDRLRWLLRTYADAPTDFNPQPPSPDAGNTTLPGNWRYYQELDHWLPQMPTVLRAHLTERYIRPHARAEIRTWHTRVTIQKDGRVRGLPPNTELANPFAAYTHTRLQHTPKAPFTGHVAIARWHHWVRRNQIDQALDWLLEHMHAGRTDMICLPPDLQGATPQPRETVAA